MKATSTAHVLRCDGRSAVVNGAPQKVPGSVAVTALSKTINADQDGYRIYVGARHQPAGAFHVMNFPAWAIKVRASSAPVEA
ncbi:hypothetical protein QFZ42_000382 [Variovorax paradoxus]|uniref:hypothetical protein n=1 Tax=Variovorax paradoxus TaxID=34073 RepID=UPI00278ECE27|nr:hypothetical protein [Variovorax paradoxus]MDQ0568548.1 hypothetical protein [Variovorax paradoxus]